MAARTKDKHGRQGSKSHKRVTWTNAKIVSLIGEYEKECVLWDSASVDYYNKEKRKQAIRRISCKLGISDRDVVKKINNLRTYYCREVAKIQRARKRRIPFDGGSCVSKWTFFHHLDRFLRKQAMPKQRIINIGLDGVAVEDSDSGSGLHQNSDTDHEEEDFSDEGHFDGGSIETCLSNGSRESRDAGCSSLSGGGDEDELFGKIVANGLRRIENYRVKQLTKIKIQHLIYKATFGTSTWEPSRTPSEESSEAEPEGIRDKVETDGSHKPTPTSMIHPLRPPSSPTLENS